MLLRGLGFGPENFNFSPPPPAVATPLTVNFNTNTPATNELRQRLQAAGITGEQAARDWLYQQTGIPFNGLTDQTARTYLSALDANAAAAAASILPSTGAAPPPPPPPPPAPSGPSLTTLAIGGAAVLAVGYFIMRR